MAKVSQVFQDNIFQTNSFQGEWGDVVFQKNVFQNNVFDVPTTVKKIINESLSVSETQVRTRELIRLAKFLASATCMVYANILLTAFLNPSDILILSL